MSDEADDAATLDEQIEEIARELALRERLYPSWVQARRLKLHDSMRQLRRMRAVLRTLHELRAARANA